MMLKDGTRNAAGHRRENIHLTDIIFVNLLSDDRHARGQLNKDSVAVQHAFELKCDMMNDVSDVFRRKGRAKMFS